MDASIVRLYYGMEDGLNWTKDELADRFGLSVWRISEILRQSRSMLLDPSAEPPVSPRWYDADAQSASPKLVVSAGAQPPRLSEPFRRPLSVYFRSSSVISCGATTVLTGSLGPGVSSAAYTTFNPTGLSGW
jgi:hypothetical protein